MAELTLGSLNLHMGRGSGGHDAPFYDVGSCGSRETIRLSTTGRRDRTATCQSRLRF